MKVFKLVILLILLTKSFFALTQSVNEKIEIAVILGDTKTAFKELNKLPKNAYYFKLKRILKGKASYKDYFEFASDVEIIGNVQHKKFNEFLSNIKKPKSSTRIDLDYVKMKWVQINNLRNDVSLEMATKENGKLRKYISQFPNKNSDNVERANIYADIHDIVLYDIQGKIEESKEISLRNIAKSYKLKDTTLIVINKYFFNEYYVRTGQLEKYIQSCKEILALENKSQKVSSFYNATVQQLLDAYIFKGDYDKGYIEKLLNDISIDVDSRYSSYVLYVKYISSLEPNDPARERVFQKFGVKDLVELCAFVTEDSKNKVNNNTLIYLYSDCADALKKDKKYEEAFNYLKKANLETQRIYSEDLTETLAAFQTSEIRNKKEAEIKHEKEKNSTYIVFIGVIVGFLIFSVFLIFNIRSKKEVLIAKNLENELLLKEVHHRIKNNFQTIASLLELQSKNIKDEGMKEILKEGQNRINSMSLIHHRLYQNEEITSINFQDYCKELVKHTTVLYNRENFQLETTLNDMMLDVDTAVPLGLIVNELTTNSFKYAFEEGKDAVIKISVDEVETGVYKLTFSDNGKGLPEDYNWTNIKSLGLFLIRRLTKQLQGHLNYYYDDGAVFEINFKDTIRRNNVD